MRNPPRLCALAGTSPCVRPHGAAGICVGLSGPALAHSPAPGFLPHGIPHPPGRALPHGPLTARLHLPQGALNFSSLGGGSPHQPPRCVPPSHLRGAGPPRTLQLRPDGGGDPGGRPRCFPGRRTSEASRAAQNEQRLRETRRGLRADARGQQPPSLAAPGARRPLSTPGNAPDGAELDRRPSSRPSGRSCNNFSLGRNDRKRPREPA